MASEQTIVSQLSQTAERGVRPERAQERSYEVVHRTEYRYVKPVERSMHLFRLRPFDDVLQRLRRFQLSVSVEGNARDYEDVFGNQTRRLVVESPFDEMVVESRSRVEVRMLPPLISGCS